MGPYAKEELLACVIARQLGGARHAAIGASSPIPATAAFLHQHKDAAFRVSLQQRREANPLTEGSRELFDLAGQGRVDVFFLGGAQIDGDASINLVQAEGRRFPGSFGSAFMYPIVPRVFLFREEHSARVLVKKVDFVSARGHPAALVTGKALFSWQRDRRRFRLESVHPGSSAEEVRANTGFDYDVSPSLGVTPEPTQEETELLRTKVAKQIEKDYPDFARRVWG
ncbi:MAG TPA: CoA synthetase [Burkholderiales bacterium]|jgi:glutaconate CoA-transferase subunit B|nr:CoA synthetase [Burkholderiales bacterium]